MLQKEKNIKGKWFFNVWFHYEKYEKKNQIWLKLIKNLFILKLFNLYILKENKMNIKKHIK